MRTGGLDTAIAYNVQTLLDPIMNISFIGCEADSTRAAVNFYASLFAQGAAEGISTFVSAGDAGGGGGLPNVTTTGQLRPRQQVSPASMHSAPAAL